MAVALVELVGSAKAPNCELDEAREIRRKIGVKAPRVEPAGKPIEDFGTAARQIAARPIGMRQAETRDDAGAMQEVVHERVDRDQHAAGFGPLRASSSAREQQRG